MSALYFDSDLSDDPRRERLHEGALFVFSPRASTRAFCDFARELCEEAFAPHDPRDAQHHLPVERYVQVLAELKPRFIHHPRSKELLCAVLSDFACDPERTYFDVPRLRTACHGDYLTSGLAYAFHPHRDTWYSAALCQLNWWLPVYDYTADSGMAFHPLYWRLPLKNSSRDYDYARWNRESRHQAALHVKNDTRRQPRPEQRLDDVPLRPVCAAAGLILFSAAQLHSTVPNRSGRTRLSIDFRTVNGHDVAWRHGAPNADSACTGTSLRDFLRAGDLAGLPEDLVEPYDRGPLGMLEEPCELARFREASRR
ncbi:MAG TPA: hypothetical protein VMV69_02775 [Pirellulales bacterium]|nr:hypothetical protein [Pirellulales bacterium]